MLLGAMNDPYKDLLKEISLFSKMGFDFIELGIEYPNTTYERMLEQKKEIVDALSVFREKPLAHAPWFFSFSHPYESLRKASVDEIEKIIEVVPEFGAEILTIHPDPLWYMHRDRKKFLELITKSISELVDAAGERRVVLSLENFEEKALSLEEMKSIFRKNPKLKLTLDIGHTNMSGKSIAFKYLKEFSGRIAHVHAHDNKGKQDEHLPIGKGNIDWKKVIGGLKKYYGGTITLEIHSEKKADLKISRKKFAEIWKGTRN